MSARLLLCVARKKNLEGLEPIWFSIQLSPMIWVLNTYTHTHNTVSIRWRAPHLVDVVCVSTRCARARRFDPGSFSLTDIKEEMAS